MRIINKNSNPQFMHALVQSLSSYVILSTMGWCVQAFSSVHFWGLIITHSDSELLFPFEWWCAVLLQQIGLDHDFFQVWGLMITILTVSVVSLWMMRCSFVAADRTISWLFSSNEADICRHPEDGWGMSISMCARSRQQAWGTLPEWIGVCDLEV